MNPYEAIGLPNVINGAGKMTYLGSSAIAPDVVEKIGLVAQNYVDMEAMKPAVGRLAAEKIGAEHACITSCCAAGIAISVASVLTGKDLCKIEALPKVDWFPKKVVIQKGHMVNFGANISQAISLAGADIEEIGTVNVTKEEHLLSALKNAAAVVFVVSHHAVFNGMLSLQKTIELAHGEGVPVIVDAAAETDLKKYAQSGADLVVFSGHKAIGGPTSGIIVGKTDRIAACQMQDKGIARMMKVGKENIMGLYFALEQYCEVPAKVQEENCRKRTERLKALLTGLPGVETEIAWDGTRPIPRTLLRLTPKAKYNAKQLIALLESGNPSIRTRNHSADEGIIQFDPRELKDSDLEVIARRMEELMGDKEASYDGVIS